MFYVYFNGEFYYVSEDNHYKHGRPVSGFYGEPEARQEAERRNKIIDEDRADLERLTKTPL